VRRGTDGYEQVVHDRQVQHFFIAATWRKRTFPALDRRQSVGVTPSSSTLQSPLLA